MWDGSARRLFQVKEFGRLRVEWSIWRRLACAGLAPVAGEQRLKLWRVLSLLRHSFWSIGRDDGAVEQTFESAYANRPSASASQSLRCAGRCRHPTCLSCSPDRASVPAAKLTASTKRRVNQRHLSLLNERGMPLLSDCAGYHLRCPAKRRAPTSVSGLSKVFFNIDLSDQLLPVVCDIAVHPLDLIRSCCAIGPP